MIKKPATQAKKKFSFNYRPRTAEEMQKRAHQSGYGTKDTFIRSDIPVWTPEDGVNKIRILPPTWDDADHYGIEAFVHYGIGADKSSYLCLQRHHGEACPICEARAELDADGDRDAAKELVPRKRVIMYVINRSDEKKGPQAWSAAWTVDSEIATQAIDESGATLPLDSPEEGYDVTFTREKQVGGIPKFGGYKIARKSSPIFDDEEAVESALEFITKNPLPEVLVFQSYETIRDAFSGKAVKQEDETPVKPSFKGKGNGKAEPEEEEMPTEAQAPELTWEQIHDMNEQDIEALAEDVGLDFGDQEFDDLASCQDWVCEQLEIEKPKAKTKAIGKPSIGKKAPAEAPSWKSKLEQFKRK